MMVVMPRSHLPAFVRLLQLRRIQASTAIRQLKKRDRHQMRSLS
jgi:hypothetical protein